MLLDGSAHLHEMDVLPDHGRRGLGGALVERIARWARDAGFRTLTLTTFRHLAWNAPFYTRLGFEEIPAAEIGPELRDALDEEAAAGLDPGKRLAMRRTLG
jgi:GNAT superfamily N-acetyltransferase